MLILGLIDSKPSAAALLEGGRIVSAVAEERLCRLKLAGGMPRESIDTVIRQAGVAPTDLDLVAVAQQVSVFEPEPVPWDGWFDESSSQNDRLLEHVSSHLAPWVGRIPGAIEAHHWLKRTTSKPRLRQIRSLLRDRHQIQAPVRFFDHHYCHAVTAFQSCSMIDPLVITLDGGGDGRSGSVYLGEGGRLKELASVDSFDSLGNFYSYVTELCGFRAEKDEGKITGLAADGNPAYASLLREFLEVTPTGRIRYRVPMYHRSALQRIRERLPEDVDIADLAASVQLVLEEIAVGFVRFWAKKTRSRNLCVAGGVFANVKLNQKLLELDEINELFVYPAMDDSGLAVGAAFAGQATASSGIQISSNRLADLYLGPEPSTRDIDRAVGNSRLAAEKCDDIHRVVAELLSQGLVVARYHGRLEFGPRALGHRSVLYQTTDPSVNGWLNQRLKRTEFMPFAPATLSDAAIERFVHVEKARDCARFMTTTFDCTELMKSESPGVVHSDGTARPQIVDSTTAPDLYRILDEYRRITGIPSLINTSFNMHEEPIVATPDEALASFEEADLDYLAIDDWLVEGEGRSSTSFRSSSSSNPPR